MKTSLSLAFSLAVCLLLSSCELDSENPLSSPGASQPDPRLVGDWRGKDNPDKVTIRISMTKESPWMHAAIIPDQRGDKTDSYDFFPTVIGRHTFLNVRKIDKDGHGHVRKSFYLIHYTISHDRVLQMWMMSQDEAADAIEDGKIKGIVKDSGSMPGKHHDTDVTLQDSSANLAKFVQHADDLDDLFGDEMETLYRATAQGK